MDWRDDIQPAKESDEKGFFVEPGGEGDVPTERSGEFPKFDDAGHDPNVQEVPAEEADAEEADIADVPMEELKQVRLQRRRVVMKFDEDLEPVEGFIAFTAKDDDGLITASYLMAEADFKDFGRPDVITVGVVTGDILNG
jgi:hypothetical protein